MSIQPRTSRLIESLVDELVLLSQSDGCAFVDAGHAIEIPTRFVQENLMPTAFDRKLRKALHSKTSCFERSGTWIERRTMQRNGKENRNVVKCSSEILPLLPTFLWLPSRPTSPIPTYVCSNFFSNCWLIFLANFERPVLGCIEATFCK